MIYLVAAVAKNGVLGKNGKMPWNFPSDLKRFRELTMGNIVVFGRKTYDSIGSPLEGRTIIVLTKNKRHESSRVKYNYKHEDILSNYISSKAICYICGGESLYREFMPFAERIYLTRIDKEYEGDAFFPLESMGDFKLSSREELVEKKVLLAFEVYERNLPAHKTG